MKSNTPAIFRAVLIKSSLLASLLLASGTTLGATVNLSAGSANATLPDGTTVPMWGYTCGPAVSGSTATCAALNRTAGGHWSPVIISVPTGQDLQINLTNHLPGVPTSLMIVGQLGGGLGSAATYTPSPDHSSAQHATWPIADPTKTGSPPPQGPRVRSFSTEVPAGSTASLTWMAPRPGTYLIESGTHPSIQGPMGLFGMLVVTCAAADTSGGCTPGTGYPGVTYDTEVPLLLSEIDPVQNAAVAKAVNLPGFSETSVWSGQPGGCGDPTKPNSGNCYPPAVNYTPRYYLINGVAFNKAGVKAANSYFPAAPAGAGGELLVRFVNAGLRMHVPSIVGAATGGALDVPGFSLIAEDGNPLPGAPRVQSELFMAAGKTYDVMINAPDATVALPVFDRQLSLSGNGMARDTGMQAYIGTTALGATPLRIGESGASSGTISAGGIVTGAGISATANPDTYNSVIAGMTLNVSDPATGVIGNDSNIGGVQVSSPSGCAVGTPCVLPQGTLTLNSNGTFTYVASTTWATSDSFSYCGNGETSGPACTTVKLGPAAIEPASDIAVADDTFTSTVATSLSIKASGILANDRDAAGYPLTVSGATLTTPLTIPLTPISGGTGTVALDPNGGFSASVTAAGTYTFTYKAENSQGTASASSATVTLTFPAPSGLRVTLVDGQTKSALGSQDYRWIVEEDRTFYVDPKCQQNPLSAGCPTVTPSGTPAVFGTNFHASYMPVVAQGCTGPKSCESGQSVLGVSSVCDIGNGACRPGSAKTTLDPSQVHLDPNKHYYISVLPGDAADPGHAMGGAQIAPGQTAVTVLVEPQLQHAAKLSVFVFEDDHPLNGEHDGGGGFDVLSPNEPGLGGFNITILDLVGGSGDPAGQMTYDEFNQPLSNSLAGTVDPSTGKDACPISKQATQDPTQKGITGVIPVCPKFEADGITLSPLAGQAIVENVPPGRYGVVATPAADRIARGEEWLQTNTLDGGKDHEAFLRINEPKYFQEFGPGSFHVSIGFANPKLINDEGQRLCSGPGAPACTRKVIGKVTGARMSRTPDERLYESGSRDAFGYTQCFASLGSPDGADFAFAKCADDGSFVLTGIPAGDWRVTIFDQWNDQIVDGITTPVRVGGGDVDMGNIGAHGWKDNLYTRTFLDQNGDGVSQDNESGLPFVATNIRYRDGSFSNFNSTDLDGYAGFNEVFPIFNWYLVETDSTRYKNTGTHVVNDAGGPADGTAECGNGFPECGTSSLYKNMTRTKEDFPLPIELRIPGSRYCADAGCPVGDTAGGSTGRVDPPWVTSYGWQSFMGQNQYLEFGKKPFAAGENGGIRGHVVYASTRPFDDPALLLQLSWEPLVPHVTINLYQEGFAADGITPTLTLVDSTQTSSWDDWAQGFRSDGVPNMNCAGQSTTDPFYNVTLLDQPNLLNPGAALPYHSQFKCYDGMHNWNQLQPAPYDGMYQFPSIVGRDPKTGVPTGTGSTNGTAGSRPGTNCTICVANPQDGTPMLPAGKYVAEMIVPPGYELVKEEDKNILIGDAYIAPVTQEFAGFGNIFIMPDQAAVGAAYNANNPLNPTTDLGSQPRHEGDTGSVETFWPCVGATRIVPDYVSIFPQSGQNAPFAGATRPLCDRKEVTLEDQTSALAKFYVFSSTHVAAHFTGIISDDFMSEFDPFSPAFGEKFSPANLPVSVKDWAGSEIARTYSDAFGMYNGLTYSSWSVNPPDPSGYIPQMMVMCMNDRGGGTTADPFYQAGYSQFCYEWSFMPGQTGYLDTPVIPTAAFAANYNHPDCDYPAATPAIASVTGDVAGPWVSGPNGQLTITALGDQLVDNYAYSGPAATTAPFNQKKVSRHYGFGSTPGTVALVGSDGVAHPLTAVSWDDAVITGTVPSGVPACAIQQQRQYGGPPAGQPERCGELVITTADGKQSVDTVTVTIGNGGSGANASKAPTVLAGGQTIQSAIDAAAPGDLIIVPPGSYHELLVMWKPVRLQGLGAASSIIDANTHPAGILDPWRLRVVCLFGLAPNGVPAGFAPSCGSGWTEFRQAPTNPEQVDRIPLEATVGWDATLNGNLAEQLQEPSLLGGYEGAGITVLAKGVDFHGQPTDTEAAFPAGTTLLTAADCGPNSVGSQNPFPSNFQCNPSRIDGLSVTNSSQGGGGIFVHGWAHNLEISNNRVYNNQGTLAGGISVGQGEHPGAYLGGAGAVNSAPGSCLSSNVANLQLPFCFNRFVNIHNNAVKQNASEGDELFSATPSGAGGVAFTSGADNYRFSSNWVCGNLTTGDGAGVSHVGFSYAGDIEHNAILFNQATNPTTPSNGGGILIMSAPDTDPTCPGSVDADCSHAYGTVADGIGPGLTINANLIMGNAAEAGAGGGIRFQGVNGVEVSNFPNGNNKLTFPGTFPGTTGASASLPPWYTVTVTNNIIANNVAGWDGGGVSLQDSIGVNLINNTIVSNDSTASSGTLFGAFYAPQASAPTPCPRDAKGANVPCVPLSTPQPAGLSSAGHTAELLASLPATVTCPTGHPNCRLVSYPELYNDLFWQNRAFNIVVTKPAAGSGDKQATVALVPTLNQTSTGQCVTAGANYWDIGLRGDTGPTNHSSGFTFTPQASVLTSTGGYTGGGAGFRTNTSTDPALVNQYCNGAKVPPEAGGAFYQVPPGTNELNVPMPVFSLTAGATVDEGNNWINISWGPLSMVKPTTGTALGNYALTAGSAAIDYITSANSSATYAAAPSTDFFGNRRKVAGNTAVDVGAVEFQAPPATAALSVTGGPLDLGSVVVSTPTSASAAKTLTLRNTGTAGATGIALTFSPSVFSRPAGVAGGTCGITLTPGVNCTINVVFSPTAIGPASGTLTIAANAPVGGSPVNLTGTGVAPVLSGSLTPAVWTISRTRNCPGSNLLQRAACALDPVQAFTLTNTGNMTLTGIAQGVLGGTAANVANYTVVRGLSTCGPAGGGQPLGLTTLAPGASCAVTVQFKPLTSQPTGAKPATVSVTDVAGTQTSPLNGTAN